MEQLYFIITDNCNLKCKHCIRDKKNNKGNMSLTDTLRILDKFSMKFPESTCIISGGEPTLHHNFSEILDYAINKFRKHVSVNTNGTTSYFQNNSFNAISRRNITFQISLDGDRKTHDIIRGTGSFDKATASVKALINCGFRTVISTTVSERNFMSLPNLFEELKELKVTHWAVQKEMPFGEASVNNSNRLSTFDWNRLCDKLLILVNDNIKLRIRKLFDFDLLNSLNDKEISHYSKLAIKNCGTAKEKLYIHPDLTVYGCTCLENMPLGNLNNDSLEKILNSSVFEELSNCKLKKSSPCNACRFLSMCNGGCIGMSVKHFGTIGMGDIRCPIVSESCKVRGLTV